MFVTSKKCCISNYHPKTTALKILNIKSSDDPPSASPSVQSIPPGVAELNSVLLHLVSILPSR